VQTKQDLLSLGWTEVEVGRNPVEAVQTTATGIQAKRLQYGLWNRLACTIHKAMGDTVTSVCTLVRDDDARYGIWLKEQLVLLLSRTHYLHDIIFVGCPRETTNVLRKIVQKVSIF